MRVGDRIKVKSASHWAKVRGKHGIIAGLHANGLTAMVKFPGWSGGHSGADSNKELMSGVVQPRSTRDSYWVDLCELEYIKEDNIAKILKEVDEL